jgi:class 3 adenylate cyclase/tetratricopeptide (TPR) repeat protein
LARDALTSGAVMANEAAEIADRAKPPGRDASETQTPRPGTSPEEWIDSAEAYIPGDRRIALARGIPMPDRVQGAGLFADISGFTPLTEALEKELGPQRGAEELTLHLNRVFHALISVLERFGGHVIYFGGDAITCWLDGDDGLRAATCALAMQQTMADLHQVVTPGGAVVQLGMKIGIAVGAARRFPVGDPAIQRMDVLAGRLIDQLADAEHHARSGEIVLADSALAALANRAEIGEERSDEDTGRRFGLLSRMKQRAPETPAHGAEAALPEQIVEEWVLPAVLERLRTGRGEFLAELRPAYPLFLRFGGIDYDDDDDAIRKLDDFVRHVQRILSTYGGNLLQVLLGDKGAYLFAVFGSPVAHEDDAARAAAAALELRDLPAVTAVRDLQIGVTYGKLRSGTYGHANRQAFTCLGDAVNLAARLMSNAPCGQIFVSTKVASFAGDAFTWATLSPISVKGKAEPVPVLALSGSKRHASRRHVGGHALPIVGRWAELERIGGRLDDALAGNGQVVGIAAEAGMGKSRLVAEFARAAAERGIAVATGECQSYGANVGYFVWRDVWTNLFRLDGSQSADAQVTALERELAAIDADLVPRAPLLQGLLDLPIPDNDLTALFDAKLRKTSLEGLLVDCLRARARAAPQVIVLEDCHWLDPLSRDLLEAIARAASTLPVMLLLAYRPATAVGGGLGIENLPNFGEITLGELDHHDAALLVRSKLQQLLGTDVDPPAMLVDLVSARAQGNPFYIEELLNFISSQAIDPHDEGALRKLELPESLHSLILSRIDAVGEAPRRTLKVASVLGRVFSAPMLPGVYPELGELGAVKSHLATLGTQDLVNVDQEAEQTYLFKHVVTQEVAYESMPFAFRSMLHERVGAFIETTEPDTAERNPGLLAHHYWRSNNAAKKREYLRRAGEAAQAAYANTAAVDYFERLVPLVERGARIDALLKLGKVLELVGNWKRAEEIEGQALALADELGDVHWRATCRTALAEVARKQGRFDEAVEQLDRAARGFGDLGDEIGLGRVLHFAGTVAAQRGDYAKAVENYESSLAIRERAGDKAGMGSVLSNLGIVAEYRSDYESSRRLQERALALRTEIGDRRGLASSMNCLGMIAVLQKRYAEARDWFQKSMLLNREVGDAWMVAICQNNLGNANRGLGEYDAARKHYASALHAYRDYDDRWALAFLLEDIALLAALDRDAPVAHELAGAADRLREAIGTPRAPAVANELEGQLAASAAGLPAAVLEHRTHGRSLELNEAIERALAVCLHGQQDPPR